MIMQPAIHVAVSFTNYNSTPQYNKQLNLVPELEVNLIGARHLPSSFGLKSVEGYLVKVISHFECSIRV